MRKLKDVLIGSLGVVGFIIWYLMGAVLIVLPLVILEIPFWVQLIILFAIFSLPYIGNLIEFVIWIWSFIVILSEPIDGVSIFYFVVCAVRFVPNIITFVLTLISEAISRVK